MPKKNPFDQNDFESGDVVFFTTKTLVGSAIRFAQRRDGEKNWRLNHVGVLSDFTMKGWKVIQAESRGVTDDKYLNDVAPGGAFIVKPCPSNVNREKMMEFLRSHVGDEYSWLTDVSCAFDMILPDAIDLRRSGTFNCSGLVSLAMLYGGSPALVKVPDIYTVTPARLSALAW